jgi:hypothetical protein
MLLFSNRDIELRRLRVWIACWLERFTALFLVIPCLSTFACAQNSPQGASSTEEPSALFTRVIQNEKKSELLLDEYARTKLVEKRRTASDPKPLTVSCVRQFPDGPAMASIPLTPDGQFPSPELYRSELEKIEKYLLWIIEDGPSQKDAYLRAEHKRKERFELMEATHLAFRFTFEAKEQRGDRTLLRYSMTPNPEYHPTTRNAVIFTRVRGTIWVDEQTSELAKIDGSVTEDLSIALFLAKVYKGSHFMQERYEIAPGVWEPTFEQYDFDGRKYIVPFSIHERTFYSDYQHVGPPKEALAFVRAQLSKLPADPPSQ